MPAHLHIEQACLPMEVILDSILILELLAIELKMPRSRLLVGCPVCLQAMQTSVGCCAAI